MNFWQLRSEISQIWISGLKKTRNLVGTLVGTLVHWYIGTLGTLIHWYIGTLFLWLGELRCEVCR